jgi:hypothetical protein
VSSCHPPTHVPSEFFIFIFFQISDVVVSEEEEGRISQKKTSFKNCYQTNQQESTVKMGRQKNNFKKFFFPKKK